MSCSLHASRVLCGSRSFARRLLVILCPLTVAAVYPGCTYGPPELQLSIANHVASGSDATLAFAVQFGWVRRPTGLSTFPDGGRWRTLKEAAAVYTCDTLSLDVKLLWQTDRPDVIRSGFEPWMGPWTEDGLYVSLRGYRGQGPDRATFVRFDYAIDSAGQATAVVDEPPRRPATSEPRQCAARVDRYSAAPPRKRSSGSGLAVIFAGDRPAAQSRPVSMRSHAAVGGVVCCYKPLTGGHHETNGPTLLRRPACGLRLV